MAYQVGQCVVVKGIGAAKINAIVPSRGYELYFATGQYGDGWYEHDFERTLRTQDFWKEWHRRKKVYR